MRFRFDCPCCYRPPAQSVEVATIRFLSSVLSPVHICDLSILSEIEMAGLRSYEEQLLFLAKHEGDLEDEELLGFYLYLTELPPQYLTEIVHILNLINTPTRSVC